MSEPIIKFPFDVKQPIDSELVLAYIRNLIKTDGAALELGGPDPRSFTLALAVALGQLFPLIDERSEWGGRCRTEDRLFDRYSRIRDCHLGYVIHLDLKDWEDRSLSRGFTVWEIWIKSAPYNPDKPMGNIGTLLVKLSVSDGAWELLNLITGLRNLIDEPV